MIVKIAKYNIIAILFLIVNQGFTQTTEVDNIEKDVIVLKEYAPSISDALKLSSLPHIIDTSRIAVDFEYEISPRQLSTTYNLKPVPSAKMKGEPLTKLYGNQLKLGFGSDFSPLVELSVNNLRSKKYSIGAFVQHFSVNGKTKIDDQTYYPNFSKNIVNLYGKRIYNKASLFANIDFQTNKFLLYGHPANIETTEKEDLEFNKFTTIGFSTIYKTNISQKSKLNYDLKFGYYYFQDSEKSNENNFLFLANFNKKYFDGTMNLKTKFDSYIINPVFFKTENMAVDSSALKNTFLTINPSFAKSGKEWKYSIGFDFVSLLNPNADAELYFFPDLKFEYKLVENFMISYFKYNGSIEANSLQKLSSRNHFISMEINYKNTKIKKNISAGLRGDISSKLSFDISANFKEVENMTFFENIFLNEKKFAIIYKDVDYGTFHGKLLYAKNDNLDFAIEGNFYAYSLKLEELSHTPQFDATISARYNLQDKIVLSSNLFFIGKRYANKYNDWAFYNAEYIYLASEELNSTVDCNIEIEYFKNKNLSAFVKFNNIFASKYYLWNYYPVQRFNVMAGVNYSF